jgi:hypothetical protein
MRRIVGWPGNTTLECGKFELAVKNGKETRVFIVIRRATVLCLQKSEYRREEDCYEIPLAQWEASTPKSVEPDAHDC